MYQYIIDPDPVIVWFESREKHRPGFLDAEMMFFIYANPEIPGMGELKSKQDPFVYGSPVVDADFKFAPDGIKLYRDLVLFEIADREKMLHVQKYKTVPALLPEPFHGFAQLTQIKA